MKKTLLLLTVLICNGAAAHVKSDGTVEDLRKNIIFYILPFANPGGEAVDATFETPYTFYNRDRESGWGTSVATFKIKRLPAGEYNLCKWAVGKNGRISGEGENEWVKIGTIRKPKNGKWRYKYRAGAAGDRVNNLLLIKN